MIDVWNWLLRCKKEIQVLSQVFHKCPHDRILSLSSPSSFDYDILILACLVLKQIFAAQETCKARFRTSLARVAKIMGSWLKDTYTMSSYGSGYRIK